MRILIVKLSAMGDIIHSMAIIEPLVKRFANIKIDWICEEFFVPLLKYNPNINRIIPVHIKRAKKEKNFKLLIDDIKTLKNLENYDYIFDLQGLIKSAIVAKIVGGDVYGFDKNSLREKFASIFYTHKYNIPYEENVVLRSVKLISMALKIKIDNSEILNKKPFLFYPKMNIAKFDIAIFVGASRKNKIYPPNKFLEVLKIINKPTLILWGNKEEEELAQDIAKEYKKATVSKKLSLEELIATISNIKVLVGGDTGPLHMAWGLNTGSVIIFGPTPHFRNTFKTTINKTVDSGRKVDPNKLDKNDFSIASISPEIVAKEIREIL